MKWKIFYSDGHEIKTYSYKDGGPETAPSQYVQVIVQWDDRVGWTTQSMSNYYVWDDRGDGYRWWGVDDVGLYDYYCKPGWQKVITGHSICNATFSKIFRMIEEDPDFVKSGFKRGERRPDEENMDTDR
ncbi:MAG: hypothetical protein ACWGQW_07305 [bacterium]